MNITKNVIISKKCNYFRRKFNTIIFYFPFVFIKNLLLIHSRTGSSYNFKEA